jgi:phosphotransferase system HPr (HPr) family protein
MPAKVRRELTVLNKLGVHARPAVEFVRCARHFASTVEIVNRGQRFSAQEILGVLLAGLSVGTRFQLLAEGPDAELAVEALGALLHEFAANEKASAAQDHDYVSTSFGFAD